MPVWKVGVMTLTGKTKVPGEKPLPVTMCKQLPSGQPFGGREHAGWKPEQ